MDAVHRVEDYKNGRLAQTPAINYSSSSSVPVSRRQSFGGGPPYNPINHRPQSTPATPTSSTVETQTRSTITTDATAATLTPTTAPLQGAQQTQPPHPSTPPLAAIILPIIIALAALIALILYLRRRKTLQRRRAQNLPTYSAEMLSTSYNGNDYRAVPPTLPPVAGPIILSERNTNYLTGLDTSTLASSRRGSQDGDGDGDIAAYSVPARRSLDGTFAEPPPPYNPDRPPRLEDEDGHQQRTVDDDEEEIWRTTTPPPPPSNPFNDPGSPVSEIGSRHTLVRRTSDVSDL